MTDCVICKGAANLIKICFSVLVWDGGHRPVGMVAGPDGGQLN